MLFRVPKGTESSLFLRHGGIEILLRNQIRVCLDHVVQPLVNLVQVVIVRLSPGNFLLRRG